MNKQPIAATELSDNNYSYMFYYSNGLTDVYLPAKFFPESCYSWEGYWDDSYEVVSGALSGISVGEMLSSTAKGSTCTFHCQKEKDVKLLNAIKEAKCSDYGTLIFEHCTDQP